MTPQQLSDRISTIAERAEQRLTRAVTKTQRELFDQMQTTLSKLELDGEGLIKQSQANRKILQKADRIFDQAIKDSGYYQNLDQFAGNISAITGANEKYFNFVLDSFTVDAQYLKSLQKSSISTIESLLANDGLESQLKRPLMEILNQNVNSGAGLSDMLNQIRQFIIGSPNAEGKLLRYSKQITSDTLFNFSRSMQESISTKSGLTWIQYVGGAMDTSRDFCISKMGRYYPKAEVEKWASQSWAGKRPGTTRSTIFIYAGGYSCRHQIIYVHESAVPKTNKDARELGKDAKEVGDELDSEAKRIADKYNAGLTPINYKSYDSIVRKAKDELGGRVFTDAGGDGVKDAVRTTIVTDAKNLKNVAKDVEASNAISRMKAQDYSSTSGYRGYLGNAKLSNGTFGEIQVNTPEMIYAKETPDVAKSVIGEGKWNAIKTKTGLPGGLGHEYYEQDRKIIIDNANPDPQKLAIRDEIRRKSREYYKNFYYSYPSDWP